MRYNGTWMPEGTRLQELTVKLVVGRVRLFCVLQTALTWTEVVVARPLASVAVTVARISWLAVMGAALVIKPVWGLICS